MKRKWLVVPLAVLHLILVYGLIVVVGLDAVVSLFSAGGAAVVGPTRMLAATLLFPFGWAALLLPDVWFVKPLSVALFYGNSIAWGAALSALFQQLRKPAGPTGVA